MYKIQVYSYGELAVTFEEADKKKAKKIYYRYNDIPDLYTELTYNGEVLNTAKAQKLFKRTSKESFGSVKSVVSRGSVYAT